MKRFVLKVLLFVIPVILFFWALNALYIRTNYFKSKDYVNKYTDAPYDLELGNVGSSIPCYALKYDIAPEIDAWNFANVTENYFWNYKVLKNYINHFKNGGIIVIEIPYFGVYSTQSPYRERFYRALSKTEMDRWSFSEWLAYKEFPILSAGRFKMAIFHDISKEEMSPFYDRDAVRDDEDLSSYCYSAFKFWEKTEKEENYQENMGYVSSMIELCYGRGMVPVLVSFPQLDILNSLYETKEGFYAGFAHFTKELLNKYPTLLYLDYSRDPRFSERHEYYKDGVHMNNAGAEEFTKTLILDLRARGLLK